MEEAICDRSGEKTLRGFKSKQESIEGEGKSIRPFSDLKSLKSGMPTSSLKTDSKSILDPDLCRTNLAVDWVSFKQNHLAFIPNVSKRMVAIKASRSFYCITKMLSSLLKKEETRSHGLAYFHN